MTSRVQHLQYNGRDLEMRAQPSGRNGMYSGNAIVVS